VTNRFGQFAILREQLRRIRVFDRRGVPLRTQTFAGLFCCPESVCYDRYSGSVDKRDLKNVLHAGNRPRSIRIEALHLRSKYRWMRHQRDLHTRQIKVESKLLCAIALRSAIKAGRFLAGEPKIA